MASEGVMESPASEGSEGLKSVKVDLSGRGWEILRFIGFEMEVMSSKTARGRFVVSEASCQPFGVLHGGTTAYIAESIASVAGTHAAKFQQVAGVELNVNHLRPAPVGSEVTVTANPFLLGSRLQVWDVKFEIEKPKKAGSEASSPEMALVAVSRVTLIVGLPKKESDAPKVSSPTIESLHELRL